MPSTVIKHLEYNAGTKTLTIYFVSGLSYAYHNVPGHIYEDFRAYREKGIYFNQHIKNKYRFNKLVE